MERTAVPTESLMTEGVKHSPKTLVRVGTLGTSVQAAFRTANDATWKVLARTTLADPGKNAVGSQFYRDEHPNPIVEFVIEPVPIGFVGDHVGRIHRAPVRIVWSPLKSTSPGLSS